MRYTKQPYYYLNTYRVTTFLFEIQRIARFEHSLMLKYSWTGFVSTPPEDNAFI